MNNMERAEHYAALLNATPWWKPLLRQDYAREYRQALLAEALTRKDYL